MRILPVYNIKGGVGKTSSAVNLAYLAARRGRRTLLWDLDPQGAASFMFRIEPRVKGGGRKLLSGDRSLDSAIKGTDFEDLDLLPADFSYRKLDLALGDMKKPARRLAWLLQSLEEEYDDVFLDCAPSVSVLSESLFMVADALLVPTIPTTLSLRMLGRLERHLAKRRRFRKVRVLPFFCMVDCRKKLHREITAGVDSNTKFLGSSIPYASVVEQMAIRRAPVSTFAGWSSPARAYERLWEEIEERVPGD